MCIKSNTFPFLSWVYKCNDRFLLYNTCTMKTVFSLLLESLLILITLVSSVSSQFLIFSIKSKFLSETMLFFLFFFFHFSFVITFEDFILALLCIVHHFEISFSFSKKSLNKPSWSLPCLFQHYFIFLLQLTSVTIAFLISLSWAVFLIHGSGSFIFHSYIVFTTYTIPIHSWMTLK